MTTIHRHPDRLFCCHVATGLLWADRSSERNGDYARLALFNFGNLTLQIEPDCPADLRARIEAQAAALQAKRGERKQVSTSGQFVTLGHDLKPATACQNAGNDPSEHFQEVFPSARKNPAKTA